MDPHEPAPPQAGTATSPKTEPDPETDTASPPHTDPHLSPEAGPDPGWLRASGAHVRDGLRWLGRALTPQPAADGALSCWLFVRLLGLVYLMAFLSLWPQLLGLIGAHGMMPAAPFLKAVAARFGAQGYTLLPTLFWLGCSDTALGAVCGLGVAAALLVVLDRLTGLALLLAWICYLSLVSVGRDFMGFQWDGLLLETGGLALLLLPWPVAASGAGRPHRPGLGLYVPAGRWLILWLLVRFMFSAGWAKLRSGDPTWRDLTALHYHFETQPLPTWLGYYAHQLPGALKKLSVVLMFVIELGAPLLVLVPRLRRYAFWPLLGLMLMIAATGNYGFFNVLSIALFVPLLPDAWLRRGLQRLGLGRQSGPARWVRWLDARQAEAAEAVPPGSLTHGPTRAFRLKARLALAVRAGAVVVLGAASLAQAVMMLLPAAQVPRPLRAALERVQPFHLVNRYGLFARMTTDRPEILIEGSNDGQTWQPYEFKYKPGDLRRAPRWNAPHQPRLDWQMWFAAMEPPEESPWLQGLCIRLLQGTPEVLWLLDHDPFGHDPFGHDPFGGRPPRYLRATRYNYRFTSLAERRATGAYWQRSDPQPYIPPVSLH